MQEFNFIVECVNYYDQWNAKPPSEFSGNFFSMSGDSSSDRSATPEPGLSYEHLSQGKSLPKKR